MKNPLARFTRNAQIVRNSTGHVSDAESKRMHGRQDNQVSLKPHEVYQSDLVQGLVGYIRRAASEPPMEAFLNDEKIDDPEHELVKIIPARNVLGASLADVAVMGTSVLFRNQAEIEGIQPAARGKTEGFTYVSPLELEPEYRDNTRFLRGFRFKAETFHEPNDIFFQIPTNTDMSRIYELDEVVKMINFPSVGSPELGHSYIGALKPLADIQAEVWLYLHRAMMKADAGLVPKMPTGSQMVDINTYLENVAAWIRDAYDDLRDSASDGDFWVSPYPFEKVDLARTARDELTGDLVRMLETRGAGILGVPLALVGYLAGIENSIWSHLPTAREYFAENALRPLWESWEEQFSYQVRLEFGEPVQYKFNQNSVRVLQKDEKDQEERARNLFNDSIITRGRAKEMIGEEFGPEDEIYKISSGSLFVSDVTGMDGLDADDEGAI